MLTTRSLSVSFLPPDLPALAPNQGGPSGSSLQNLAPLLHHYGSGSGSPARTHYQPDENERGETQRWENGGSTEERADEGEGETEGETNGKSLKTTSESPDCLLSSSCSSETVVIALTRSCDV